ncbi:hypothetical protein RV03_GL001343 [Enterococcus gallinarum]|nr:hypothetical protein RV03_GL001343 [Enterococcus gallinarum]
MRQKRLTFLRLPPIFHSFFNKLSLNFLGKAEIKKAFSCFLVPFLRNALISHF